MRARLLLAFLGIAAFGVLAAAAGIYAFREVGSRLDIVESRIPPTLSAFELSRSAERIISAAPTLLATTDRARRDEVNNELAAEIERLNDTLRTLESAKTRALPLDDVDSVVRSLAASLGELDDLVARRLEISERIGSLRRAVFESSEKVQRLLAPWLEVMAYEIAALLEDGEDDSSMARGGQGQLASQVRLQQQTHNAQRRFSAAVDMLVEASTLDDPQRLPILEFQLGLVLIDLRETGSGLDPKLKPLFLEHVATLRRYVEGPASIIDARRRELALITEGEELLAQTAELSARLTDVVDRLGGAAKQDIGQAIRDALQVQQLSARALVVLAMLSLLTSVLIVWRYVGGNIVRRLTALSDSMLAIAQGSLRTPVSLHGSDEITAMGRAVEVFRRNAIDLEQLLEERKQTATRLEHQVAARTRELSAKSRQLEIANKYKSHFLASASHDLRQPLHALNLFVAQLHSESNATERRRVVERIDAAVSAMNELFEVLLDMSRLEAGIVEPHVSEFPIDRVLQRIESTFTDAATQKGLRLSVMPSGAWVRSDQVLLERILMNLVSNAVRCTTRGGIVIGCRRRAGGIRVDVCDSGPGIAPEQQEYIFGEYYRLSAARQQNDGGFGLGLAIVDRLGRLLDHEIGLDSRPGRGSRFSVSVPLAPGGRGAVPEPEPPATADPAPGKAVLVVDDEALALEGMERILRSWGCDVLTADSAESALSIVGNRSQLPDLIIADYRLANETTGIQAIEHLRAELGTAIPAFLISGDTAPERLRDARDHDLYLLHKPVPPMRLRAMLNRMLMPGASPDQPSSSL